MQKLTVSSKVRVHLIGIEVPTNPFATERHSFLNTSKHVPGYLVTTQDSRKWDTEKTILPSLATDKSNIKEMLMNGVLAVYKMSI